MKLSVVIPCFNERATIEAIVDSVRASPWSPKEIIIVDDSSTDGTQDILLTKIASKVDRIILKKSNQGKGAALRDGFDAATGDVVIIQDADLEYDPQDYLKLISPIAGGKADVVYGSRFMSGESRRVLYYWHSVGNKILTFISNVFTNLNLSDMETCYKVFRHDVLRQIRIEEDRFGFEPEITAKVARLRCRVYEVGISYSGRTYEEGKKIGWKDGVRAVWCIVKYNVFHRAPQGDTVAHTVGGSAPEYGKPNRPWYKPSRLTS
jgi:glycosyltransferase involved in cell wall biosynthesis